MNNAVKYYDNAISKFTEALSYYKEFISKSSNDEKKEKVGNYINVIEFTLMFDRDQRREIESQGTPTVKDKKVISDLYDALL